MQSLPNLFVGSSVLIHISSGLWENAERKKISLPLHSNLLLHLYVNLAILRNNWIIWQAMTWGFIFVSNTYKKSLTDFFLKVFNLLNVVKCFANTIRSFLSSAEKNNLAIIVALIEWNHTAWSHLKFFSNFFSS